MEFKKTNLINLLTVLFLALIVINNATAEETIPQYPKIPSLEGVKMQQNIRDNIKTQQESIIKTKVEEKRAQIEKETNKKINTKLKEHTNRTLEKLSSTLDKMEVMEKRLEERISKMEQKRVITMSDTRKLTDEVKNKISQTREEIKKAYSTIDGLLQGNDSKESALKTKGVINSVNKSIKETHTILVEIVRSIASHNSSVKNNDNTVTSTSTTTSN